MVMVEKLGELKIEANDVDSVLDFWKHFGLDTPNYLIKAAEDFKSSPDLDTQDAFRSAICRAIYEGREDVFQDELFQVIKSSSNQILFRSQFREQLEEVLSNDGE